MNEKRAQLIADALALLGDEFDAARREVASAMGSVERQRSWKTSGIFGTQTRDQKIAARQLALAPRKLQKRLNDPDLAEEFSDFPFDRHDFAHWIARADVAANTALSRRDPEDVAGRRAALEALRLLTKRGLKTSLTRTGTFCKLAAIIFGKPAKDMMTFCVSAKDQLDSRFEKRPR